MRKLQLMLAILALTVPSTQALAAGTSEKPVQAYRIRGDFAVPESPAFILIGGEPDQLLRPVSVNELTAVASRFQGDDDRFSIPRSVGVEVSPGLLIGGRHLTVQRYLRRPALYRTRVSLATHRPDGASTATRIALGIRVTLRDGGDLRADEEYREAITRLAERMVLALSPRVGKPTESDTVGEIPTGGMAEVEALQDSLKATIREYSDRSWNQEKIEVAAAVLAASADSTGSNLHTRSYAAWGTFGLPIGGSGQFLLGVNGRAERTLQSDVFRGKGSLSSRLYFGTSTVKFLAGGRGNWEDGVRPTWTLEGGGEMAVGAGLWLTFTGGVEYGSRGEGNSLVTHSSLRYELPSL
jgi:hypothetical protein